LEKKRKLEKKYRDKAVNMADAWGEGDGIMDGLVEEDGWLMMSSRQEE
jgi:hypothetical protein